VQALPGNQVDLLPSPAAIQQACLQLVREAEHHLHLLFYIWRDDCIRDLLIEKATQGVQVRVLVDALGSFGLPGEFLGGLIKGGGTLVESTFLTNCLSLSLLGSLLFI